MADGIYRGNLIRIDPIREKYITDKLDELNNSDKLGRFLTCLIRLAMDSPEVLSKNEALVFEVEKYGMTDIAKEHYDECKKQISVMMQKIDAIYDMCFKMYTLSQFGKMVGLEKKSSQMARAEFMLERQLTELCSTLGITNLSMFESGKLMNVDSKASEVLEYIINTYDGVVNEIKAEQTQYVASRVNTDVQSASPQGITQRTVTPPPVRKKKEKMQFNFDAAPDENSMFSGVDIDEQKPVIVSKGDIENGDIIANFGSQENLDMVAKLTGVGR